MPSEQAIRCALRGLTADDAARIAGLVNDEAVTRFMARIPYPYTIEDAHAFLAETARTSEPGIQEGFAIEVDGDLAGVIGYEPAGTNDMSGVGEGATEIGYWIGRDYWGRGIATDAVKALVDHVRTHHPGRTLTAGIFNDNEASARVLQKAGFTEIGVGTCRTPARAHDTVPSRVFALDLAGVGAVS